MLNIRCCHVVPLHSFPDVKRLMAFHGNTPVDNTVLILLYTYGETLWSSLRIGLDRGSYYIQFYS